MSAQVSPLHALGHTSTSQAFLSVLRSMGCHDDALLEKRTFYAPAPATAYWTFALLPNTVCWQLEQREQREQGGSESEWRCVAVDVYNIQRGPTATTATAAGGWSAGDPCSPAILDLRFNLLLPNESDRGDHQSASRAHSHTHSHSHSRCLNLEPATTGSQLLDMLGEPHRKGGGQSDTRLGPSAWLEWTVQMAIRQPQVHDDDDDNDDPLMTCITVQIEMAGAESKGASRWQKDKAGAAIWGVCTFALV
ncbi:hypothetical protein IE81DRAFT_350368 [Ceraceosorus guamensis]|uniref:Uncharacterized protein n=1 Tax=Ceraceosorus guamensis TaxID=1522189 RepID=A0A316VSN1_9BASI|nr:hypothetical protein IE81DRAFT_350368 [Ceraceosorus guamensis]PWN39211.1 hypothetical protein IE81DRAFT_350368 [Ceraceosorus guamensis]